MPEPSWFTAGLVALMIATALFHLARMLGTWRLGRAHTYDIDAAHVLMGVAMVVMLVEPRAPAITAWMALGVAVPTVWFSCQAVRRYVLHGARAGCGPAQQALASAAMLYILVLAAADGTPSAALPGTAMTAMSMPASAPGSATGIRVLVPLAVLVVAALVVWKAAQVRATAKLHRPAGPACDVLAPTLAHCCQLAMTVTSGYMLVAML
jgi:Domain of unknown function (DUF5134)